VVKPSPDLCVIAPCFNESPNILPLVRRVGDALRTHPGGFELVLVDDASADDTWEQIGRAAAENSFVRPVRHRKNRGIVEGWRSGLWSSNARRFVTIDADLQYRPEDIPRLAAAMDEHKADFVHGWRRTQVRRSRLRAFLTWGLSGALNFVFGTRLKDNKSGFVLYSRECLRAVLDFRFSYRYFQHFIAIAAYRLGFKIVQVPVVFEDRAAGQSFITSPLRFSLESLTDFPRAFLEFWILRRLPSRKRD